MQTQPRMVLDDCLNALRAMEPNSIDSLVTDPPAGISFMGKAWDDDKGGRKQWIAWMSEVMSECMRVMKPGAHGLVWAIPRTSHWTATALEDAGFEVRDVVTHLFGSGFPKSMDISKAIDKAAGAERETLGTIPDRWTGKSSVLNFATDRAQETVSVKGGPATADAKTWQGFGTALKPASEHWILVRKPCSEKTVAANVQKYGTGAINVDASRVNNGQKAAATQSNFKATRRDNAGFGHYGKSVKTGLKNDVNQGRFPANLVLSHTPTCTDDQCDSSCAIVALDEQSGNLGKSAGGNSTAVKKNTYGIKTEVGKGVPCGFGDSGGASRFFARFQYCAKISKSERNAGCEGMAEKPVHRNGAGLGEGLDPDAPAMDRNTHPTVKPKKLMSYFCTMITPPGGIVLDPFMGSGSTGIAAIESGFQFVGIECDPEYFEIAKKRVFHAEPPHIKEVL